VLAATDPVVREIEDALRIAERSGDDMALVLARAALGVALVHRHTDAERFSAQTLLTEVSESFQRRGHNLSELPFVNVCLARERARRGTYAEATPRAFAAIDHPDPEGGLLAWTYAVPAMGLLVETLLDRGAEADVVEAEATIERLAAATSEEGLVIRDIWLLRLSALLARARGDDVAYRDLVSRYRAMAESLGFEGHIAWAAAMIEGGGAARSAEDAVKAARPIL
jgi:hypothetical protein